MNLGVDAGRAQDGLEDLGIAVFLPRLGSAVVHTGIADHLLEQLRHLARYVVGHGRILRWVPSGPRPSMAGQRARPVGRWPGAQTPWSDTWAGPGGCLGKVMSPSHVVVDGSNIATEGRSTPSLQQLDDAIREFQAEFPDT